MRVSCIRLWLMLALACLLGGGTLAVAPDAYAVPAFPGTTGSEHGAGCKSHPGELVTLDQIPWQAPVVSSSSGQRRAPSKAPATTLKSLPLLVIVVGYDDMHYNTSFDWHSRIFEGDSSVSAYYRDMSFGQFTFEPARETSNTLISGNENDAADDGIVFVNVGLNHGSFIDMDEEECEAFGAVLIAALEAADEHVDFAAFDADCNGEIGQSELAVCFVLAGYEASVVGSTAMPNLYTWSHMWNISDLIYDNTIGLTVPHMDGVSIDDYVAIAEQAERQGPRSNETTQEPVCALVHELGHYLGLPDLYDTAAEEDEKGHKVELPWKDYAVGDLSVMANGMWGKDANGYSAPCAMDAWCRYTLGWYEPQVVETGQHADFELACEDYAVAGTEFNALKVQTQHADEYYLLECKQPQGWDANVSKALGGGGIVAWHVDESVNELVSDMVDFNESTHRPGVMPLYVEKDARGAVTFIGTSVDTSKGVFSAQMWESTCRSVLGDMLDLPLYGEGDMADAVSARLASGIEIGFLDDSAMTMHVRVGRHSLTHVAEEAGCEAAGVAEHWVCELCGKLFADENAAQQVSEDDLKLEPLGHTWGEGTVTTEPTCEAAGVRTFVCEHDAAHVRTEEIAALGHDYGPWTKLDATYHQRSCTHDAAHVEKQEHAWDAGVQTKAPAVGAPGEMTYTCTVCAATRTEEIAPLAGENSGAGSSEGAEGTGKGSGSGTAGGSGSGSSSSGTGAGAGTGTGTTPGASGPGTASDSTGSGGTTGGPTGSGSTGAGAADGSTSSGNAGSAAGANTGDPTASGSSTSPDTAPPSSASSSSAANGSSSSASAGAASTASNSAASDGAGASGQTSGADNSNAAADNSKASGAASQDATASQAGSDTATGGLASSGDSDKAASDKTSTSDTNAEAAAKVLAADGTAFGMGASIEAAESALAKAKSDVDPKGASFAPLLLKSTKQSKTSLSLSWKKIKGAKRYAVYASPCGKANKLVRVKTTSKRSLSVKKAAGKKLKKGTYYKLMVIALDAKGMVLSASKIIHVATKGGKVGNHKSVSVSLVKNAAAKEGKASLKKAKLSVKKGATVKLKGKAKAASSKLKVKKHRAVKFESSKPSVAKVSSTGKIKAKRKGTCYVYAYAQNGAYSKLKVTVK